MIKVKIKELKAEKDIVGGFTVIAANALANNLGQHMERSLKAKSCSDHPHNTNTITVSAQKKGTPKVDKTSFCCQNFKNSIVIDIK